MFDLSGKIAVVIGGTSGIGAALARGLGEAGATVAAASRRSPDWPCDVTDARSLQDLLNAVIRQFGDVHILVNCAGRTARRAALEISEQEWTEILDTNLTGTLRACQIFGRHMVERRWGRIINIASLSSFVGLFEVAAYGASKSGVASLTRQLAVEWASYNVCVNAICPGVFRTPMNTTLLDGTARGREFLIRTPMKRFGRLEELAGAAVYLSSEEASFTTGQILVVDGGFMASGVNQ